MSGFGDSMTSKNDPAATDLDYYSQPENYTGSNLHSLQRFVAAKNEEDRLNKNDQKNKVVKDAHYHFFYRYKHLLHDAIFVDDLLEREKEESSEEESDGEIEIRAKETTEDRANTKQATDLNTITEEEGRLVAGRQIDRPSRSRTSLQAQTGMMSPQSPSSSMMDGGLTTPDSPSMSAKQKYKSSSMSAGRQSTAIMRVKMDEMSRKIRAKQLYEKFQKAVRVVSAICRLASARGKRGGGVSSMRTFMDIASDESTTEGNMKSQGLSFDPNYFKAKREISLSNETKAILTMPSARRSPEQVQTAMFGLQSLRSYAEYPLHMQEKLANVAWYEVVAPKRIIIRQGHVAENFYFILSGNAVVTILLRDPLTGSSSVKIATVMRKGMSFGELALLHHSKRTATVTSQDIVQLLSIGRDDFFDIFMASSGPDAMPDHIKFVSNIDFMKHWPIHELVEHPEHCLLHFFKRNTVIVSNSNESDWMYIVKSGSCQVLKQLKGVTANTQTKPKWTDSVANIPKSKLKAIIFASKVDSGLRKRSNVTDSSGEDSQQDSKSQDEDGDDDKRNRDTKYSKENYSKNPATKKAHFSAKSSFAKRKGYQPPTRNVPKKPERPQQPQDPKKSSQPVFVQVSNLKPRDVFGLESVEFNDDIERSNTTVTLISGGAECVMLLKAFYTKHATDLVKKNVRQTIHPYPDEDVFQDNLQIKANWFLYKKVLLNDITSQITEQHPRLNKH